MTSLRIADQSLASRHHLLSKVSDSAGSAQGSVIRYLWDHFSFRDPTKWWSARWTSPVVGTIDLYGVVLVGVFVVAATLYSVVTPPFEAPDEVWHFRFITHVAETGTLPTQDPANPGPWRQEGSQPPLYYLLVAPLVAPIDVGDVEQVTQRNPHAAVGRPDADGNVNFVVHTARDQFPWRGTLLAVHLARLVSVLLGAATVVLTYVLARDVCQTSETVRGESREQARPRVLPLGAALLVALNPQFLFMSAAVNNDSLVIALATLGLVVLVRLVERDVSQRRLVMLGTVIGLAALSKLSGLGLWLLAGLVLVAVAWKRREPLAGARWLLTVFGIGALIGGWWYVRNWLLYGDPTGLSVMLEVFGHRTEPVSPLQLVREFEGLRWSFWAVFGWFNVLPPRWMHWLFDLLSLVGVVGTIVFVARRVQIRDWITLSRLAVLVVWLGIVAAGLGRWTMMTSATQGRLLFPAISVIGVLLFTGWMTFVPMKYWLHLLGVLSLVLGCVALYAVLGVIRPAYSPPPALTAEQTEAIPNRVTDVVFGDRIALVGYQVTPDTVRPGDSLTVTLYWQGITPMETDYSVFIHLIGGNEIILNQRDSYPGRGNAPTSHWTPDTTFEDTYRLHVPATASPPQSAWIAVGLYSLGEERRLTLPDGTDRFPLKSIRLVPAEGEAGIPNPVDFNLGGRVELAGFEVSTRTAHPGETIDLALYWRALSDMDTDYTVFTQLLSDDWDIWAQDDGQPLRGDYPTSRWAPGEVVRDVYHLTVDPETPAGVYHLEVGMYVLETGERLYRTDDPTANSVRVTNIRILAGTN